MNLDDITRGTMLVIGNIWQTPFCILTQLHRWMIVGLRVLSLKSVVNLPLASVRTWANMQVNSYTV